jgi:hypothetical protein
MYRRTDGSSSTTRETGITLKAIIATRRVTQTCLANPGCGRIVQKNHGVRITKMELWILISGRRAVGTQLGQGLSNVNRRRMQVSSEWGQLGEHGYSDWFTIGIVRGGAQKAPLKPSWTERP